MTKSLSFCTITLFFTLGLAGCSTISPQQSGQRIIQIVDQAQPSVSLKEKSKKAEARSLKQVFQSIQTRQTNINDWTTKGRIGIQTKKSAQSASFYWNQQRGNYTMQLVGPLGAGSAKISGRPGKVTLQTTKPPETRSAATAEKLLRQRFGWSLPISSMYYWIRGLPAPQFKSKTTRNKQRLISRIIQQGWSISYQTYVMVGNTPLPTKLVIQRPNLRVKIIITTWRTS